MSKKGIDVSYANGSVDWSKAKRDVDFAIVRSSFGSDSPNQIDNQYYHNAEGCIRNQVPFGIYHFAYFINETTAAQEADFALRMADKYRKDVKFIALDIEEDSVRYATQCGASPDWKKCAEVFLDRIRKAGYVPVIYTNQYWLTQVFGVDSMKKYKLWYAAPGAAAPKYEPDIWQYSWSGQVSGINGNVDMDLCYDDSLFRVGEEKTDKTDKTDDKNTQSDNKPYHVNSAVKVRYSVQVMAEDGVNLRQGPGTGFRILGAVPYGRKLSVTRQTSGGGYSWGLTEFDGQEGWIALNYTRKVQDKSIDELAQEVIRGQWGAGEERERLLHQAGYDYQAVQRRVNELLTGGTFK